MTSRFVIDLARPGPDVAWGFRLQGGSEFGAALSIQRVFSGTPSDGNLQRGDIVSKVNGNEVTNMTLARAQELIKSAGNRLSLFIQRDSLPIQDLHISSQAPHFAPSDYHSPTGPRQPPPQPAQPAQHFYSNAHPVQSSMTSHLSPGPNISNVNFQPKPDLGPHPVSQQHHHQYQPSYEPAPNVDWQASQAQPTSQQQPQHQQQQHQHQQQHYHHQSPPYHHQQEQDVQQEQQEHSGDVDDEHLKPVKEIKSMFNHAGTHDGANIVRKGHQVRMAQPKKPHGSTKYQPPSPVLKPAATTHVQSAKHPPVYQQRSSYNPLDFQGVNPKSPIPPNRPPGLIQRGAVDLKPKGTGLDYQQPNHFRNDHHPQDAPQQQVHHQPTITPQGNLDPLTDFYLHGLNAKCDLPDFSKSANVNYSGKILPPRSEVAIKTPTSAAKKKEFKPDQSAVYRILQEEEEASKQRGRGGPAPGRGATKVDNEAGGRAYQMPASAGQSRLAELLEKDQAQLAPYHEGPQQEQLHQQHQAQQHQQYYQIHQHAQQPQQQQQYHQQHQQQQQQYHHEQPQQYHHEQPQHYQQQQQQNYQQQSAYQQHSPTKHLMTSTAQFVPSPSREQAPRHHHDYQNYQPPPRQQQAQQQHHNWNQEVGRHNVGHAGLPQTDF